MGAIIEELVYGFNRVLAFIANTITETGDAVCDAFKSARHMLRDLEKAILFGEFIEGDPSEFMMAGLHI
ncbi:MAG: hypothetical protein KBD29_03555 [Candidatus Magasanikbacteria bacterium]|nr:hypothetical protein [Candidatus Magasanikbacteria bacterium]